MKPSHISYLAAWCVLACPIAGPARAEDHDHTSGTLGLYIENDSIADTDRYYTSGVMISWSSADLQNYSDTPYANPLLPLFNAIPYINDSDYQKNLVFVFGQNIYTPSDTLAYAPIWNDRPYAGWLYGGFGVVWKDAVVRNSLVFDIGVVGPWSMARQSQRFVHDIRASNHPNGWSNQLHNELGVILVYERTWRWPRHERRSGLDWEMLPHAGAALGNVKTYLNAGAEIRAGWNLPDDFGTSAIGPSTTTSTPVDGRQGASRGSGLGCYLFTRVDGRAVGHNIFLDGNTFGDSQSVGHNPFVADLSLGVAMNYKDTKIAYALVYRTKEFSRQEKAEAFGTLSLNWTF